MNKVQFGFILLIYEAFSLLISGIVGLQTPRYIIDVFIFLQLLLAILLVSYLLIIGIVCLIFFLIGVYNKLEKVDWKITLFNKGKKKEVK